MRYGDLNPVRAGLVKSPKDWPWSTYRHYAFGEPNALVDDAAEYLALGKTAPQRRKAYQALFAAPAAAALHERRPDLVLLPFIGDMTWVEARLEIAGVLPTSRAARRLV
jgi:putative transposase